MDPSTLTLRAWGDESVRDVGGAASVYLLAAMVSEAAACETYRTALRQLHTRGHKLHWRDLDDAERSKAIELIASFDVYHVVVVGATAGMKRQERARARCLERLAWELDAQGVEQLTLESRQAALDEALSASTSVIHIEA